MNQHFEIVTGYFSNFAASSISHSSSKTAAQIFILRRKFRMRHGMQSLTD